MCVCGGGGGVLIRCYSVYVREPIAFGSIVINKQRSYFKHVENFILFFFFI